jgi:hypothetical protein
MKLFIVEINSLRRVFDLYEANFAEVMGYLSRKI